ncbi:spore germination protein [Natranaerovirga pectinivora]|uniref:Spore germination protein n=1 Tax=Natranaerovirga pectinivora TaxID=682400 RepID=A0A4R3MPE1_9FIRM|nr:glycosyl hydrolase family 18 protein [Natranaerovirga pectinivora]TCT17155.1 spore germination protein [Natranaerovirga pectinivora]
METYVVKPEDTLFDIAMEFGVTEQSIMETNTIQQPEDLVVGQALIIPIWGTYYYTEPGDTLEIISDKTGVSVDQLILLNEITDSYDLEVGTRLFIPPTPRKVIDVTAYVDLAMGERLIKDIGKAAEQLTFINVFSYEMNPDGTLNPIDDEEVVQTAYGNIISPIMVVTNIAQGQFSKELATIVLTNEEFQDRLLSEALLIMENRGYDGIDFDFEYLGIQNRDHYNAFLKKAVELFKPLGYIVSTAVAPKDFQDQEGIMYEGHDYKGIDQMVDYVNIMTYEWSWLGGAPRPVAPINAVRQVMEYAVSVMPKEKIMMGIPLYGYDWTLSYEQEGDFPIVISPQRALEIAKEYGAEIQYDKEVEAPFFTYTDEEGAFHIVWFEDARSIQAKFDLVKELGIKGINFWLMGKDFPQNWLLVDENFIVRKNV